METSANQGLKDEGRRHHPSVEIELVDESLEEELVDAQTPESFDPISQYDQDKQGEPTLYKRVIYVPATTQRKDEEAVHPVQQPCKFSPDMATSHEADNGIGTIPGCNINEDISCGSVLGQPAFEESNSMSTFMSSQTHCQLPSYWKQWAHGLHPSIAFTALLVTAMNFVWILALGSWLASSTGDKIGTAEVFLSTFISGTLFAVLGSQPVLIVGVSVPFLVFASAVYSTADRLSLDFLPWMGWIVIWAGVLVALVATFKTWTISLARHLTQFSWEIVQMFVGLTFLRHGAEETINFFMVHASNASALLSLWLMTSSFLLGTLMDGSRRSSQCLSWKCRQIVADFGPAFIVLALVALSEVPKLSKIKLSRVDMPRCGYHSDDLTNLGTLVRLRGVPLWAIFLALILGVLLAVLVLIDHDYTSSFRTSRDTGELKEQNLTRRRRDLLILAASFILCGLLGLPLCYGLFPQTTRHILALTSKRSISSSDLESQNSIFSSGDSRVKVRVQRVSSLLVSLSIGIPLLPKVAWLLKKVPKPIILGYCLQMGVLSFKGLGLKKNLSVTVFKSSPDGPSLIAARVYIITQIGCVAAIFAVSYTQAALISPLFLLTAIWLRHYVMARLFQKEEFEMLDQRLFMGNYHEGNTDSSILDNLNSSHEREAHNWFQSTSIHPVGCESRGSSFSQHRLPLPSEVKSRRLKERSSRRKRKRHLLSEAAVGQMTSMVSAEETTKSSMRLEHKREWGSWGSCSLSSSLRFIRGLSLRDNPSCLGSFNENSNSKGLARLHKRARNKTHCLTLKGEDQEVDQDLDVHSNILYDPYWGDAIIISSENDMFDESKADNQQYSNSKQWQQLMAIDRCEKPLSLMQVGPLQQPSDEKNQKQMQQEEEDSMLCKNNDSAPSLENRAARKGTISFDEWANVSSCDSSGSNSISAVASASTSASTSASGASTSSTSNPDADGDDGTATKYISPSLPLAFLVPAHPLSART